MSMTKKVKNQKLHEKIIQSERFDVFVTDSVYQFKKRLFSCEKTLRILIDDSALVYACCNAWDAIHREMIEVLQKEGYDVGWKFKLNPSDNLYLLCVPNSDKEFDIEADAIDDNYFYAYAYEKFTIFSPYQEVFEKTDLYKVLGEPIKKLDYSEYYEDEYLEESTNSNSSDFAMDGNILLDVNDIPIAILPDNVYEIGEHAFTGCGETQYVVLPENVHTLNDYSFRGLINCKAIWMPLSIKYIGYNLFPNRTINDELEICFEGTMRDWFDIFGSVYSGPVVMCQVSRDDFLLRLGLSDAIEVTVESMNESLLTEATRNELITKSKHGDAYKDQSKGKNRFERRTKSKISRYVKQYNDIDMNNFFKNDILTVGIDVNGETNNYVVKMKFSGVLKAIQDNIKRNNNKLDFRIIFISLAETFKSGDVYMWCSCPDWKFRFDYWSTINKYNAGQPQNDPGKGIANPRDSKGGGCKHSLLVLNNLDWLMKVASVINNYIHYAENYMKRPFENIIFPALYGVPFSQAVKADLLPDEELETGKSVIDAINDYGRTRTQYKKKPEQSVNPRFSSTKKSVKLPDEEENEEGEEK